MDIKKLILNMAKSNKEFKTLDIIRLTGFSREYVTRIIRELIDQGEIRAIGKGRAAKYLSADNTKIDEQIRNKHRITKVLTNKNLEEDKTLKTIQRETGIFRGLKKNVKTILEYAFLEMMNNAIEHSRSPKIQCIMERTEKNVYFSVTDSGVGVFNNIMNKRDYTNEMMAIEDLLKGKQTTAPENHSGQGIFFTSKAGDLFTIKSFEKKLVFDCVREDVFVVDVKEKRGTRVTFSISINSNKILKNIFDKYSIEKYSFDRSELKVKLFEHDGYVSRSQARRILAGMDEFKSILIDFKDVETVGQAFCDEIFRVWLTKYPDKKIEYINANDNIVFMIERSKS